MQFPLFFRHRRIRLTRRIAKALQTAWAQDPVWEKQAHGLEVPPRASSHLPLLSRDFATVHRGLGNENNGKARWLERTVIRDGDHLE